MPESFTELATRERWGSDPTDISHLRPGQRVLITTEGVVAYIDRIDPGSTYPVKVRVAKHLQQIPVLPWEVQVLPASDSPEDIEAWLEV